MPVRLFLRFFYHISSTGGLGEAALPFSLQLSALSSQLSASSLQPSALSPQPSALSPQPSALSPQPSALSPQPSAFSFPLQPRILVDKSRMLPRTDRVKM